MTQTARNYAQALYELNVDAESINETEEILKKVKEVGQTLSNPTVSFHAKENIIDRIFPVEMRNFLKVSCKNQKSDMLGEIFEAYREIVRRSNEILKATLYYVTMPTEEQQEKIKGFLCKKFGVKGAELSFKEDKSLMGGFILRAGGREFDWSIQGRFRSLAQVLKY